MHPGPPGASSIGFPKIRPSHGDPLLLEEVLVRHPRLRLYIMHAGWPLLDRTIALLYAYPQVYLDVAVINWTQPRAEFHRYLRSLVEAGYGKRIMFGSDQMVWPEAIDMSVAAIQSADYLTAEQRGDIFFHNAARFLRLEPTTPVAPKGAMETCLASGSAQPCETRACRAARLRAQADAMPSWKRSPRLRRSPFQDTTSSRRL